MKSLKESNAPARLLPRAAFVVQLGSGIDPVSGSAAGRVEHVSSGRAAHFASTTELLEFMQDTLVEQGVASASTRP